MSLLFLLAKACFLRSLNNHDCSAYKLVVQVYLGVCFEFFFGIIFLAREYYRVSEPGCPRPAERNLIQEIASDPSLGLDGRLVVSKLNHLAAEGRWHGPGPACSHSGCEGQPEPTDPCIMNTRTVKNFDRHGDSESGRGRG